MGQFFKFVFASCLGVILAIFALIGIGTGIASSIAAAAEQPKTIKPNSVLTINLSNPIPEKTNNLEMDPFDIKNKKILGLTEIIQTLEKAKEDDNIKGVYLNNEIVVGGISTLSGLREAMTDFKDSGKFIIANGKYYTQGAYYLASAADKIYANPTGLIELRGFGAQIPFYKEFFDKAGIKMQVFHKGKFKGASEPYRLKKMSDENRLQTRAYLTEMHNRFIGEIAEGRGMTFSEVNKITDGFLANQPSKAKELGIIDEVGYEDQALAEIRSRLGLDEDEKINMISLKDYNISNPIKKNFSVRQKVAVVYAEGIIIDGKSSPGSIGDKTYNKIISKIRKDDNIKAVVLRVNSRGGSAMASESIWRELSLLKETGKPLVVSMGDYAASGGYYISCLADSIYAEETTLTGSIGVVMSLPSVQELMQDKIGINYDTVTTGKFAIPYSPFQDLSPAHQQMFKARADEAYDIFLTRVAEGREKTKENVNEIAQGRVWTGTKALELGLVDRLAGLDEAIVAAAGLADLEEYRITEYPAIKDPLTQFLEEFVLDQNALVKSSLKEELGEFYSVYKDLKEVETYTGLQARMPVEVSFK